MKIKFSTSEEAVRESEILITDRVPTDLRDPPSGQQCEELLQNYIATGIGKEYLQKLLTYKNASKVMSNAAN
jgi:hypothetical protein